MPGIVGMANTYNMPNYVGELFGVTPTDTPFLSAIGGLTGGDSVAQTLFQWQSYDLRDAEPDRTRTEGADAPDPEARVRVNAHNVLQIHQEALAVSYTKMAATGQYGPTGSNHPHAQGLMGPSPPDDELTWQVQRNLEQIARDIEKSFLVGEYHSPSDNTTARRTRGLMQAIESNVLSAHDGTDPGPLTEELVIDLLQQVWENGGIQVSETATIIANAWQKRKLTRAFITDRNYQERTRNVGGVNVQTIETDFGALNIMLNRHMPPDAVVVASLDECAPVFLNIPGKGFLFTEQLALTGASEQWQLYGEVGLRYGNERTHGKLTDLTVRGE